MNSKIIILFLLLSIVMGGCSNRKIAGNKNDKKTADITPEIPEHKKIEFEYYFIEGLKQKMIGSPENAIQYFNNCLAINPKSAVVLFEMAKIHISRGDITSARHLLTEATNLNPDNRWYQLLLAQIYQSNKQFQEAGNVYSNLMKIQPDNSEYYYMNALNLSSAGKYNEALKIYEEIEKKFGYTDQVSIARQQLFRLSGKNKEAYLEVEKLIKRNPDRPEYYGLLADMYKEDGNMKKALEYYNKVLEKDPYNGFIQFSLATFYLQNQEFDKAFGHTKAGFENEDVEIDTKIQLYLMLITASPEENLSPEQMEELVKVLAKIHPDDPRSYSINADYYLQQGNFEEARIYIRKSLDMDPNSYPLWEQLVIVNNQLGDHENMVKDSEKAIELFPTQTLLYVLNAVAYLQMKDYEKALKTLEAGESFIADNKRVEAQFEMYKAEAYYNLKKSDKAFQSFEKVIEIEPENFVAMNNYAYYLSVRGEQLDRAESLSSKVIMANPDNPTYLDTHAWVLFKRKEYRLAKHYMETALKNGGDLNDVIVEHYGDILFMLNDIDGAVQYWKKSLELGNESEILQKKIEEKKFIEEAL
jgi:tetratricopeptide (TPR) repeat protein